MMAWVFFCSGLSLHRILTDVAQNGSVAWQTHTWIARASGFGPQHCECLGTLQHKASITIDRIQAVEEVCSSICVTGQATATNQYRIEPRCSNEFIDGTEAIANSS